MANDRFPDDKRENDACNVQNGFRFLSLVAHTHLRPDLLRAASRQSRVRREDMCPGWVVFRAAGAECFAKAGGIGAPCGRTVPFLDFSLCLSRACLGKVFVFIYKWLKKGVFRTCGGGGGEVSYDRSQHNRGVSPAGEENAIVFFKLGVCSSCVCLEPVLANT